MPYQTSTNFMYYNKDLLTKAGIKFPSASPDARMTWDTVTADAKTAQKAVPSTASSSTNSTATTNSSPHDDRRWRGWSNRNEESHPAVTNAVGTPH